MTDSDRSKFKEPLPECEPLRGMIWHSVNRILLYQSRGGSETARRTVALNQSLIYSLGRNFYGIVQ